MPNFVNDKNIVLGSANYAPTPILALRYSSLISEGCVHVAFLASSTQDLSACSASKCFSQKILKNLTATMCTG
jgi:hypothetical protein